VRLSERDVAGPLLCSDMYGAPYALLAVFLGCVAATVISGRSGPRA
jgi:hypothetical protein